MPRNDCFCSRESEPRKYFEIELGVITGLWKCNKE